MTQVTNNAQVKVQTIENIQGTKQLYVTIQTTRGKVHISVGEKNYAKLEELLTSEQADANKQPEASFKK